MMSSNCRALLTTLWTVSVWVLCPVKAYVDICDEPNSSVYCTCENTYGGKIVACFIFGELSSDDTFWHSLSDVDNVISLKLHPRFPERLSYIPLNSLQDIPKLKSLFISEGNLGNLKSYAISGLKTLEHLELKGNEITGLEPHAISDLPKLKIVALSNNLLQEILADSMSELFELEQLSLDRNNISRIESCAFCDLQNLRDLMLQQNQITDLTEYTFRGLRFLNRLDLYRNQIRILNDKIFKSMPRLVEIDLKDNLISHVAPRAFAGLHKLQRLMLNGNKIKTLPDHVFMSLPDLRSVDLYNNQLETLQAEVIESMENAKVEHFSFAFKENPFLCDCRLHWVERYINVSKSYQLTRELKEIECILDRKKNETVERFLKTVNCTSAHTAKPRAFISTSYSVTKSTPIELKTSHKNSVKNKAHTEASDSYVSDDDEEDVEDEAEAIEYYDSGHGLHVTDVYLLITSTFLTVWFARRRSGT